MKRITGQIPSWHATSIARSHSRDINGLPARRALLLPIIVDANHESGGQFLEPCAVPAEGATVRIVAYERIEYPRFVRWGAFWISYGRDGRVIASVGFNVAADETFVYMWRMMLEQTEPDGEVRTNYYTFNNENVLCQSLHAVLRVTG